MFFIALFVLPADFTPDAAAAGGVSPPRFLESCQDQIQLGCKLLDEAHFFFR